VTVNRLVQGRVHFTVFYCFWGCYCVQFTAIYCNPYTCCAVLIRGVLLPYKVGPIFNWSGKLLLEHFGCKLLH